MAAELLYQRGRPPRATYRFKHALIQDAAYASLLKSTRQQVHRQVAQVLEAQFPRRWPRSRSWWRSTTPRPGSGQAIPYWQQAGQQALQRSANRKRSSTTTGLKLLATLPETPARPSRSWTCRLPWGRH